MLGHAIAHYRIVEKIGEGGMGVVYRARDERLDRSVAVKVLHDIGEDETLRERFLREARVAAQLNHPHVCQIYEIGEEGGRPFLVMELLQGESLAARLGQGALPIPEIITIASQTLGALAELHARGFVHRDLKPSNLYLTPHGVKLLDFGLARWLDAQAAGGLTVSGSVMGTPSYMAPEQALGQPITAATDLFAMGVILYEMASGQRPFAGRATPEVLYNIVHEPVPPLGGSPEATSLSEVIQRAAEKNPARRYTSASEMAEALRETVQGKTPSGGVPGVRPVTRLMVLPFRMLVPDAATDFLAFSLPDAVASTLAQLESLVVRSTLVASQFAGGQPDLRLISSQTEVDAIVTGTLLRAGDQLRLNTQLIEVPSGTLIHSFTSQAPLHDLFRLQDELASRVVESLALRLSARENRLLKRDVPATASAYEFYLRGNQHFYDWRGTAVARDLYLQCIELDARYAPAWARLGRCYRLLAKFTLDSEANLTKAEEAFQQALDLNPDLAMAHNLYAQLEADLGRAPEAMQRLLQRARSTPNDAELFAGLVHVCRYCGLLDASLEADARARRIDPNIPTSVAHTHFMLADYQRSYDLSKKDIGYMQALTPVMLGREEEASRLLRERLEQQGPARIHQFLRLLLWTIEGATEKVLEEVAYAFEDFRDPEGHYYWARTMSKLGKGERALEILGKIADAGYYCVDPLLRDPWLAPVRGTPGFEKVLRRAEENREAARAKFRAAGGEALLGAA
jgi:serine/threonine protein kinase/tetratricopeptide (TPR) repeat protein